MQAEFDQRKADVEKQYNQENIKFRNVWIQVFGEDGKKQDEKKK